MTVTDRQTDGRRIWTELSLRYNIVLCRVSRGNKLLSVPSVIFFQTDHELRRSS